MYIDMDSGENRIDRPKWYWVVAGIALLVLLVSYVVMPKKAPAPSQESMLPATGQVVTYTASGFSPNTLTIEKGTVVTFKNSSGNDVRVASIPHPIHDSYPTRGGCVSSTFDSCNNIAPGQSWSFQFDIIGTWGYHDHLRPNTSGTIIVQ